jgi:hypothetical protein
MNRSEPVLLNIKCDGFWLDGYFVSEGRMCCKNFDKLYKNYFNVNYQHFQDQLLK